MKLPALFPVVFFAGGTLLSPTLVDHPAFPPRVLLLAITLLLLFGWIALHRNWIWRATLFAACAWLLLGQLAVRLERKSTPPNLANALIESGKLDVSTPLRWRGRLRNDPLELPWGKRYEINLEEVGFADVTTRVTGGLRLTYYRPESPRAEPLPVRAGDDVEVFARATPVRNFGDPGSFDYRTYLARQNIQLQGTLRNPELLAISGHPQLKLSDWFARARGRLLHTLNNLFAFQPEDAALAGAMLLGDRSFVDRDRVVDFQKTGVYHVLVLAGLHVGALAAFFLWLGRRLRLGLFQRVFLTLVALFAYAAIVEDRPPIARAVIMAAVYLSARLLYRRMDLLNVAAISALVILIARPSEISDPSFLLSFAAVGAIGAVAVPWIDRWTEPYRRALGNLSDVTRDSSHSPRMIQFRIEMRAAAAWLSARLPRLAAPFASELLVRPFRATIYFADIALMSLILQLGMMPLLAYYFHRVTLAGPFANIPAVLLTGMAVPLGFLMLAAAFISRAAAALLAKLMSLTLAALMTTVTWFAQWHTASFRIPAPPLILVAIFAALVVALSSSIRARRNAWWRTSFAAAVLATAALIATHPFSPRLTNGKLELTTLDVGQGDSLFVAFPQGHTMLVDAGGEPGTFHSGDMRSGIDVGEDVVSPYLWSRGLKQIDVVALTHAHEDHLGGLPAVLENFKVRELWVGRDIRSGAYRHVLEVARSRGVLVRHLKQGDSFSTDGVTGTVLWPEDTSEGQAAKNDDSLVIRLCDGDQSLLLPGDIERPSERKILGEDQTVGVNFLKVAHHGSKTSTTDAFLAAAHPAFGAISVGRDNSFGHPSPEVIERLEAAGVRVYRTDQDGAITAMTDGKTLAVSTFLHPQ
jgi:competence protein ComEC